MICDNFAYGPKTLVGGAAFTLVIAQRAVPATITSIDFTLTNDHAGAGPHGQLDFFYRWYDVSLVTISTALLATVNDGTSTTVNLAAPAGARYLDISARDHSSSADTNQAAVLGAVNCVAGASNYCAYGTRPQGGTVKGVIVTTALIDALLLATGVGAVWITLFDGFIGAVLWGGDLCASLPAPFPVFTNEDFIGDAPNIVTPNSRAKWWTALQCIAWSQFCECVPGPVLSPPFVPPPIPSPSVPDAAPANPVLIACDNLDLCSAINDIARQVRALTANLQVVLTETTLIQRQGVPFGYLHGLAHSALSGSGDFTVQGIVGLSVTFDVLPPIYVPTPGDPATYHQIGKVTIGTADGWERSWQPTHSPYLILPIAGAVTRVGWAFPVGIVATITELVREP